MEALVIAAICILLIIFDFAPLLRKRQKKEAWVYSVLLIAGLSILVLESFIEMPTITELITKLVGSVIKLPQ